ncbi:unnamed protein product [Sphagnum jensenii]|uniref:Uncharacterized protein n=1 Tax=Sphagnum jensenii TaxID=128206 RepID=A0ABP0WWP8_9BRYO
MLLPFTKQHFLHPFRAFNYVLHMYSVCNFLDFCLTIYSCFYRIKFMFCSILFLSHGFFVLVRLFPTSCFHCSVSSTDLCFVKGHFLQHDCLCKCQTFHTLPIC